MKFVREVLGGKPYDKQTQILRAVVQSRRVSVVGCNGSGKDWAAARVVQMVAPHALPGQGDSHGPHLPTGG